MVIGRKLAVGMAVVALAGSVAGCAERKPRPNETILTFEHYKVGQTPPGFTTALTGGGGAGVWVVEEDATAPGGGKVLAQTSSDSTKQRFPVCVYDGISAKDVAVSVQFKPLSGQVDASGGVIVRYKDKDNYYVARANALEDNVRFYKVVAGKRTQIANMDMKLAMGAWHSLKLQAQGTHFTVTFDGKTLEADDATFQEAGLIGLWTKADSVTSFAELKVKVGG